MANIFVIKETLCEANQAAKIESNKKRVYVIESQGKFFVDSNDFIRSHEMLHSTWENGNKIKE